ELNFSTGW
nr:adipokinetic hormone [Hetrodes pupus]prf//2115415A adipokinetic peptide [Phymateus leprosus]